jgi:exopolysaccharide production protein ExoQ
VPPKLALYGSLVFIFLAFRRDARNNPYPASILWLPAIWMMRCGSRNIDFWLGGSESGRWDPILIAVLVFSGIVVLVRRPCAWSGIFAHNSAILIFYFYIAVSLFWADAIENPAVKIMRPFGDLVMAMIVATEADPKLAIVTMFRRTAILLIPLSVVLVKYFPPLGRGTDKHWGTDMWVGVTTHKNPLGQLCMVSLLAWLWTLEDYKKRMMPLARQWFVWIYVVLTLYLFVACPGNSRSSTAIFCFLLFLLLHFGFGRMQSQIQAVVRRIITVVVVLVIFALVLQFSGTSLQALVAESFGKNATLSDRTYLWSDVVRLGMKSPFFGTGYGAFWVPSIYSQLSPMVDNRPEEAHNGYLETYANLGVLGVILLLWMIFRSIRSAMSILSTDFEYGRMRLALLFTVVVMNYSEAAFPRGNHLWWFGFLVAAFYAKPWVISRYSTAATDAFATSPWPAAEASELR